MFRSSSSGVRPPHERTRRRHFLLSAGVFLVLGFHVGVWAVQLASLSAALHLDPGSLGAACGGSSAAGVVTLAFGGRFADRFGRRPVLLAGFGGTALAFALLSQVDSLAGLVPVFILYGLTVSFVDLGANTVGSDYERAYDCRVMTSLHAGFSLGALLGAAISAALLWAGAGFRVVYLVLAAVLAAAGLAACRASLPPRLHYRPNGTATGRTRGVWRIPGVALAIAIVTVTFFGDGSLESFLSVYLTRWHMSAGMLSGLGIGGYHLASLTGRLTAARVLKRWGERRVLLCAGLLAALGIAAVVGTALPAVAVAGLLIVGLAVAPVIPSAMSLAGRSAPGRSGQAVATTTAVGYGSFIVGPMVIGGLADATTLRTALTLLILTPLVVAALTTRWPSGAPESGAGQEPPAAPPQPRDATPAASGAGEAGPAREA